jgi:opacity protein-like surface antigen
MKHLNIIASAALLPLLATTALADTCYKKAHGGFSIGAHVGYGTGESKFDRTYLPLVATSPRHSADVSARGAVGGLALAYGHVFANNLFAGLEIKGDLSGVKGKVGEQIFALATLTNEFKQKESFGANIKLGGMVHSVLPYAQFGIVSTKFENILNLPTATPGYQNQKTSKRLTGFEFGVGIDVPVAERFTVGAKFLHTEYNTFSYRLNSSLVTPVIDAKFKPRTNAFLLTAKYRVW